MINLIILSIIASVSFGKTEKVFKVGAVDITVYDYPAQRITMSEKCDKLRQDKFCPKIEFLKNLHDATKKANLTSEAGGANPGSIICTSVLKGIVVVGVDPNQNENSFCKLPSGLYIDSGTLTYYSKKQ